MKKLIMFIGLLLFLVGPIKAYASSPNIEVKIDGEVKKGNEINIIVSTKDLQGLYAASVNFTYNKSILSILEISPGEVIKQHSDEIMEIGGEVDTDNNKTSYSFTFLGDKEGVSGNIILVTIKAKVISDDNLNIGKDDLEVKLVKRLSDTVVNYDYQFIGYSSDGNDSNTSGSSNNNNITNNNTNGDSNKEEVNNNSNNGSDNQNTTNTNKDDNKTSENNSLLGNQSSSSNTENNSSNGNGINQESNNSNKIDNQINEEDKKEDTFFDKIFSGGLIENIINNIKDFISGNNNKENISNEEINSLVSNEDNSKLSESNMDKSTSDNNNLNTSNDEQKDKTKEEYKAESEYEDKSKDEYEDKDKTEEESKENLDSNNEVEKNKSNVIVSNNEEKSNLIIYSLIVLFILSVGMYYYRSKKINSSK